MKYRDHPMRTSLAQGWLGNREEYYAPRSIRPRQIADLMLFYPCGSAEKVSRATNVSPGPNKFGLWPREPPRACAQLAITHWEAPGGSAPGAPIGRRFGRPPGSIPKSRRNLALEFARRALGSGRKLVPPAQVVKRSLCSAVPTRESRSRPPCNNRRPWRQCSLFTRLGLWVGAPPEIDLLHGRDRDGPQIIPEAYAFLVRPEGGRELAASAMETNKRKSLRRLVTVATPYAEARRPRGRTSR